MTFGLYGRPNRRLIDMAGQRIGRVTIVRRAQNQNQGNAAWLCRCDCGAELIIEGIRLRSAVKRGDTRFCCRACRTRLVREGVCRA